MSANGANGCPRKGGGHTAHRCNRMERIEFVLPWPPTTNHIWKNATVAGRPRTYRSKKYKDFLASAAWSVRKAILSRKDPWRKIEGDDVSVELSFYAPNRRRYDVDNRVKAVFDVLTHEEVWDDDSQVRCFRASKVCIDKANPRVEVEIRVYKEDDYNENGFLKLTCF